MRIKTKLESIEAIKKLGLNQFPEVFLNGFDEQKINSFLEDTQAEWYDIRDKTVAASPKARVVKFDEVINYCKEIDVEKFTVSISFRNYQDSQVCVGELCIRGDNVDYFLSNTVYSPRDLLKNPDHSGTIHLFDKKIRYIKGLQEAIDYSLEHNLLNTIVEFWVYNTPSASKMKK